MTPRLVATDLDGTLLRDDHTLSQRTVAVLERLVTAGVPVVLATGRPQRTLEPVYRQLPFRPITVCANGAGVYDPAGDCFLDATPLQPAVLVAACARIRARLPEAVFAVELDGGRRMRHEPGFRVDPAEAAAEVTVAALADLVGQPAAKLLVKTSDTSVTMRDVELTRLLTAVVNESLAGTAEATYSSGWGMAEVSALGVTKAAGLAWVAEYFAVKADDVVVFGDMPNDIPMFAWAGWAVAVANAHPDARTAANAVTGSNNDDGVATHLERLCFGREP